MLPTHPINFSFFAASFLGLVLFFFHLRVFDEFKDYDHDLKNYPERPVPSGLIKLDELRFVGIIAIFAEILISMFSGVNTVIIYFICLGYSMLMYKEFFIRQWLRSKFTLYIILHEVLVFPLMFFLFSFQVKSFSLLLSPTLIFLSVYLGLGLFLMEVARKIRPHELEVSSKDTYTANYGIIGATVLLLTIALLMFVSQLIIINNLGKLSLIVGIGDLLLFLILLLFSILFMHDPLKTSSKKLFISSGLFMLFSNIFLSVSLLFF